MWENAKFVITVSKKKKKNTHPGPVMDIMCGADNSITCNSEKWFSYMGSISNGYSPFNIFYIYTNDTGEYVDPWDGTAYLPNDPSIVPCDEPVPNTDQV